MAGRIGKIRDIDLVDAGSGDFIGKSLNDGFAVLSERRASVRSETKVSKPKAMGRRRSILVSNLRSELGTNLDLCQKKGAPAGGGEDCSGRRFQSDGAAEVKE